MEKDYINYLDKTPTAEGNLNLSGRGDKDLDFVSENYGFGD